MNTQEIKTLVAKDSTHTIGALLALFSLQKLDEQQTHATTHQNGQGFNALDAEFMSSLARQYQRKGSLSPAQIAAAQRVMPKYAQQLQDYGYEPLVVQVKSAQKAEPIPDTAKKEDNVIRIQFSYSQEKVALVKTLSGRQYHAKTKTWTTPIYPDTIEQLMTAGFNICAELRAILKKAKTFPVTEIGGIPGLKMQLYPYQQDGVAFIESRNGRAIVGDEMGLGKTPQALAWLQLRQDARPAIVVMPASVKLNWRKEALRWMTNPDVQVLTGTKPQKITGGIILANYDILTVREKCTKCGGKKVIKIPSGSTKCPECKGKGKFVSLRKDIADLKPKAVILDEAHYIKSRGADRTEVIQELCKLADHVIPLSGTPIVNRPAELYTAINIVDPKLFPSYFKYAQRYCGATHNGFGWDFNGASNTQELHHKLTTTIMIRRKKSDVLTELPPKRRAIIPIEIPASSEYYRAEKNFQDWLRDSKPDKTMAAENAEALIKINYLKQLAVDAKLKSCITWIHEFLDSGEKLVVFAHHKHIVNALITEFKNIVVKIDGSVSSASARQKAVDEFQNNENIRLFIGTKAAAEGITLTKASNTCFIELQWQPGIHEQMEDRVHRIGQEANSVTAWYLLAENTIEEDIAELIDSKREVVTQVLDGENVADESMLTELLRRFREK